MTVIASKLPLAPEPAQQEDLGHLEVKSAEPAADRLTALHRLASWILKTFWKLIRNTSFILIEFPFAIVSFAVLLSGFLVSIAMLPIFLAGVPLGYLTMRGARIFANIERARLRRWGWPVEQPEYREETSSWSARFLAPFSQPQYWADLAFGVINLAVSTATWIVAILAWVIPFGILFGVFLTAAIQNTLGQQPTYQFFMISTTNLWEVLPYSTLLGVILLAALPWFMSRLAGVQARFAVLMIGRPNHRELSDRLRKVTASRAEVLNAEAQSLRKLERDIHDGPQQQLVRLGMDMAIARLRLQDDPSQVDGLLEEAQSRVRETLAELRALTRGFAPPLLADRGLYAALRALCARATVPVDLDFAVDAPLGVATETTAYFVVSESLTNAAKHSAATEARVCVTLDGRDLIVTIGDNGLGGATIEPGGGIDGLRSRVEAHDGNLVLQSPKGGPTSIRVTIPDGI